MSYVVDFGTVSTVGLESSPVAAALAGLRANEARYFKNKYDHVFTVEPAEQGQGDHRLGAPHPQGGARHRHRVAARSRRRAFQVENIRMAYVFYESGLSINVMYTIDDAEEAGRRVQALRRDGGPRRARARVQVREAEVEAGRHDPRLVLRDQGRVLSPADTRTSTSAASRRYAILICPRRPASSPVPESGITATSSSALPRFIVPKCCRTKPPERPPSVPLTIRSRRNPPTRARPFRRSASRPCSSPGPPPQNVFSKDMRPMTGPCAVS